MSPLPTLAVLNTLTCSQNCLLMLRVLGTSDLSFMCGLFSREAMEEVARVSLSLLDGEGSDCALSEAELTEFRSLVDLILS